MYHNPNVIVLGSVKSSKRLVTTEDADPATFLAGLACRRASNGGLRLSDNSTAALVGISLGADLSNAGKTALCRKGLGIPLRLKDDATRASLSHGVLTFTAVGAGPAGNDITITVVDTLSDGSASVSVDGLDIEIAVEAGTTTSSAVVDAIEESEDASALITAEAASPSTPVSALSETALDGGANATFAYAEHGKTVYTNDEGLACDENDEDASATSATYAKQANATSLVLDGVNQSGQFVAKVATVDMIGGL